MKHLTLILQYIAAGLIVLLLGGVAGWYFFLRSQTQATASQDAARGLGTPSPSFGGISSNAVNLGGASEGRTATSSASALRLWQADRAPVAGFGFVLSGSTTKLYFAERASGYVFSGDLSSQTVARLTNTLKPKTYEAFFSEKGSVILRGLDARGVITTFSGKVGTSTSEAARALEGVDLSSDIMRLSADPKDERIAYLARGASGAEAYIARWDGSNARKVFSSPITDWRMRLHHGVVTLVESPSDGVTGYSYSISSSGAVSSLIGGLPGLFVLPAPEMSLLLYSTSDGGRIALSARGKNTRALPLLTVADKCAWAPGGSSTAYCAVPSTSPTGNFINEWYQGEVHTSDTWWKVDAEAGTAQEFFSPIASDNESLDVEDPAVDPSGTYIAFRNATDQSLWVLRIAP